MSTAVREFVWTAEAFEHAGEAGVIPSHADLIEGVVYVVSPQGAAHAWAVRALNTAARAVPDTFVVGIQMPVRLAVSTEPEPDLYIARGPVDRYRSAHPGPEDLELVVEVSDTTLTYDTTTKLAAYRAHGVAEVWVVDLQGRRVLRYLGDHKAVEVTAESIAHSCGLVLDLDQLW